MQKHEMMDKIIQYQMRQITTAQVAKALDEYTAALRQPPVSGELPISCVNEFEKPEYCSQRNNHLCQKCKDW
jgi:hypothetical protein